MDRLIPDYEHASYLVRKVGTCFALTIVFPDGPPYEYQTFTSWSQMNNFILEHIYVIPYQAQHDTRARTI